MNNFDNYTLNGSDAKDAVHNKYERARLLGLGLPYDADISEHFDRLELALKVLEEKYGRDVRPCIQELYNIRRRAMPYCNRGQHPLRGVI